MNRRRIDFVGSKVNSIKFPQDGGKGGFPSDDHSPGEILMKYSDNKAVQEVLYLKGFGCVVPGEKVGWLEKATPEIGVHDALLRPLVIAPCSSDVHNAYEIGAPAFLNDRILGHEALGEIVAVGTAVKDFKIGDKVVVPCVTPDWTKPGIQDGCHQHMEVINDSFKYAFSIDGVFAEYFVLPDIDSNGAHLPEGMPYEKAIMVVDMMSTGFHGAELADVQYGDSVVVLGIGPVGLMAVAGAALRGAGKIYAVGTRPNCVKLAREYGANEIISYKDGNVAKQIRNLTQKKGVDKVIIAGGDAESFSDAIKMVKPGGTVANINFFTGIDNLSIPVLAWGSGMAHKKIVGGLCPGGRRRMERLLAVVESGRVDPGKLITHTFKGLEKVEDAFYLMVKKPADLIKPLVYVE